MKQNRLRIALLCMSLLQGCNTINDFWLGKDNTEKPTPLEPIKPKTSVASRWTTSVSRQHKPKQTYIRLKPVVHQQTVYAASYDGVVKAIDKRSGQVLWTQSFPNKILSGPSVNADSIAVTTDKASVLVLNRLNGSRQFEAKVSGQVLSTPLFTQPNLLIAKPVDDRLYAFNTQSGQKVWGIDHGSSPLVLGTSSSPVPYQNTILAGFSDGKMDVVDKETGRMVWQKSLGYISGGIDVDRLVDISTDPLVDDGHVYVASYQGYIVSMSLREGNILWSKPASTYHNLSADSNHIYMTDTQDVIWAYDKVSGKVKWKQPALSARGVTEPVVVGRYIVAGDKQGFLHVLNTRLGTLVGRYELDGALIAPIIVDKKQPNQFYAMTTKGNVHALTLNGVG